MLPPFIIEQIRKREEDLQQRRSVEQPRLEIPLYPAVPPARRTERDIEDEEDRQRGVVVVDLM